MKLYKVIFSGCSYVYAENEESAKDIALEDVDEYDAEAICIDENKED